MQERQKYNGWHNYETWNVALWIQNDETLYREAVAFIKHLSGDYANNTQRLHPYTAFIRAYGLSTDHTGDDVAFNDHRLNHSELDAMLRELVES